jgi:SAM-dependent methyltransferase
VYLNGWDDAPECLDDPRIMVARSQEHGDRGDAGKMFWADEAPGYYLSCDDDILYPPDYARRLVAALQARGKRAVVGCHGVLLREPVTCYRRDRTVFRFGSALEQDTQVHLLGTGVCGWHAPTLRISRDAFRVPNMADVWLGEWGQQQRVPFWCLRREAGWLRDIDCAYQDSIFRHGEQGTGSDRDKGATELEVIQRLAPWHIWPAEETTMDSSYSEREFWERRYSSGLDSGPGSGGEEAAWKVEQVAAACKRKKVGSVLDLGCGDGRLGRAVVDRLPGASYLGIDQAPAALEQARKVAAPGMEYAEGDLTAADLPPADLVLCLDVLFHLESAERHAAAIASICRFFRRLAIVAAWNEGIVDLYRGEFAPHTVYRPFVVADPSVKVEEIRLPMVPQKSLFILTRPRRK